MKNEKKIAITVKNIKKEFILPQNRNSTLKQAVVNIIRKNRKTIYKVLDDISFDVYEGDFLGIIGRNGSGKSTLLKLIAGVYEPTAGNIYTYGGLTPFIELGVGFNPELSGRDNVYLNGAMLGFTRKQMAAMYDDIVAFAEIESFMDQKLKNYSSGMQVRLAFSIAIKAENDILMFDEVLAVGDANFQEKCLRQFKKLKRDGKTIVLVTHSMDTVEKFCNRVVLLSDGKIEHDGSPAIAIDRYNALNMGGYNKTIENPTEEDQKYEVKKSQISSVRTVDSSGKFSRVLNPNEDFLISITIDTEGPINNAFLAIRICESENQLPIIGFDSECDNKKINLIKGKNEIKLSVKGSPLISGMYYMVIGLYESSKRKINYGRYNGMLEDSMFMLRGVKHNPGLIDVKRDWL